MNDIIVNHLTIKAEGEKLQTILDAIKGEDGEFIDFNRFVAEPANLFRGGNLSCAAWARLDIEGVSNEYEWRCEYWGCPSNACDQQLTGNTLRFLTAEKPVLKIVGRLSGMFPEVEMEYSWCTEEYKDSEFGHHTLVVKNRKLLERIVPKYPPRPKPEKDIDCADSDELPF